MVSILILLEVTLEDAEKTGQSVENIQFQSLFYWKLLWKTVGSSVSTSIVGCFNPYSIGSYSGSFSRTDPCEKAHGVSILILLEVTLEVLVKPKSITKPT